MKSNNKSSDGSGQTFGHVNATNHSYRYFNRPPTSFIMPPRLIGGGIKRCFCLTSDRRLSRTARNRKTKIGKYVAHDTRDSRITFKVKRSKVKVTRLLWLPVLVTTYYGLYGRQHNHNHSEPLPVDHDATTLGAAYVKMAAACVQRAGRRHNDSHAHSLLN